MDKTNRQRRRGANLEPECPGILIWKRVRTAMRGRKWVRIRMMPQRGKPRNATDVERRGTSPGTATWKPRQPACSVWASTITPNALTSFATGATKLAMFLNPARPMESSATSAGKWGMSNETAALF